ncbi:MAG: metallophosphoesterase, partial [Bacteroidota bacterium]
MRTMAEQMEIELAGEHLILLGEKALYWPERRALLMADLHLGKAGHFRKHGVPVSGAVMQQDLDRMTTLIAAFEVSELIMLGDLFHSYHNQEVEQFGIWLAQTG